MDLDAKKLNELGAEGWEAVGTMTDPQFNEYDRTQLAYHTHFVLLKREIVQ